MALYESSAQIVIEPLEGRVAAAAAAAAANPPAGAQLAVIAEFSIVSKASPLVLILTGTLLTPASRRPAVGRRSLLFVQGLPLHGTPKGGGSPCQIASLAGPGGSTGKC